MESLGLSPGAILPVIPDPLFGTPDSKLIEMRLLDRSQDESAPMQACAAHLNPVKTEENPHIAGGNAATGGLRSSE